MAAGRTLILLPPGLPDTLVPSEKKGYSASVKLPEDFPLGKFPVQLALSGRFGASFTTILTPVLDTLAVADSLFIRPTAGGLNFDRVSKGRLYPFRLKLANQSMYGLAAGIWTRDISKAHRVARALKAGTVWINKHLDFGPNIPFGGAKQSGIGVEFAEEGLYEFTQIQVINEAR